MKIAIKDLKKGNVFEHANIQFTVLEDFEEILHASCDDDEYLHDPQIHNPNFEVELIPPSNKEIDDGGYAFPRKVPKAELKPDKAVKVIKSHGGMTLREYYTGQALAGLCSRRFPKCPTKPWVEWTAEMAVELADETIKMLKKDPNWREDGQ